MKIDDILKWNNITCEKLLVTYNKYKVKEFKNKKIRN